MNGIDKHLDELFNVARAQSPEASFDETIGRFTNTISAVGGKAGLESWVSKMFSINGVILGVTALIVAILALTADYGSDHEETNNDTKSSLNQSVPNPVTVQEFSQTLLPQPDETIVEKKSGIIEVDENPINLSSINSFGKKG